MTAVISEGRMLSDSPAFASRLAAFALFHVGGVAQWLGCRVFGRQTFSDLCPVCDG